VTGVLKGTAKKTGQGEKKGLGISVGKSGITTAGCPTRRGGKKAPDRKMSGGGREQGVAALPRKKGGDGTRPKEKKGTARGEKPSKGSFSMEGGPHLWGGSGRCLRNKGTATPGMPCQAPKRPGKKEGCFYGGKKENTKSLAVVQKKNFRARRRGQSEREGGLPRGDKAPEITKPWGGRGA